MKELIHEHSSVIVDADGAQWRVRTWGEQRADGTWWGWLEFEPRAGETLQTGQETSQPSRAALAYWASGLEDVYLEGAFVRALEPRRADRS
jgi:hypothetical protein